MALRDSGYSVLTVRHYLECPETASPKTIIIRHDVDRKIRNAVHMAGLEHSLGIHTTYYFRYPSTFRPEIIATIRDMGHEIGYHYETFSKARGDPEKAISLFESELRSLRTIAEIHTICMHGSPLSPYDNRDLWKTHDFKTFGILGEAFLSMEGVPYFSDTGRNWSGKNSLRDAMPDKDGKRTMVSVETTDDLIAYIRSGTDGPIYLTLHPERWALNSGEWIMGAMADYAMNAGKKIIWLIRT